MKYGGVASVFHGPDGLETGYIKYNNGKIRIVMLSSHLDENKVSVSDITNLKDIF